MKDFFSGFRKWHVVRVGIAYLVVAWLVVQLVNNVVVPLHLPDWTATFVIVVLAIGFPVSLVLAWAFQRTPEAAATKVVEAPLTVEKAPVAAPAIETSERKVLANSVAVLPFENMSPKPEDAYFAAGLHEEILNRLAKISALNVIARTSVLRYKDGPKPVPEIAKELNVQTVMEGSVRFAGERVRVTTQLIDGATDLHLWSETYERPLGDIFAIETDIAVNVANALQAALTPKEQSRVASKPTQSPAAYAFYLQSVEFEMTDDFLPAIQRLQKAVEIDPDFALAYAKMASFQALSLINTTMTATSRPEERAELEARLRRNIDRAIALDPDVPLAYSATGMLALIYWRWNEAERAFARVIDAAPNEEFPRREYAYLLALTGRNAEALATAERAAELDPDNPNAGWYGFQLHLAGRHDEAAAVLQREIALHPARSLPRNWLAFIEIARGRLDAAILQLEISERLVGSDISPAFLSEWALSYARSGRRADAERLFARMKAAADNGVQPGAGGWAVAYLAIGDEAKALEWLEVGAKKAANHEPDEGYQNLLNLKLNVTNDPRLKKPEFANVLSRIKGD